MKRFFRSITGKTVSFVLCVLAVCVLMGSAAASVFMFDEDYYTQTKEQVYENTIMRKMHRDACADVFAVVTMYKDTPVSVSDDQLIYEIRDKEGNVIGRSEDAKEISSWSYSYEYEVMRDENGNVSDVTWIHEGSVTAETVEYYIFNANIKDSPQINSYSSIKRFVELTYSLRYWIYLVGFIALLTSIAFFVVLMAIAGRRNDTEELVPGPLNKIPFDILAGLYLLLGGLCFVLFEHNNISDEFTVMAVAVMTLTYLSLFIGLCMSMAVRIKQKNLIKGSLTYLCLTYLWKLTKYCWVLLKRMCKGNLSFIRNIPLVWKTVVITLGLAFVEYIMIMNSYRDYYVTFWAIKTLILIPVIIYVALNLKTLQKGGVALASGDLSYHVDTKKMFWDFKKHGENLNSIAEGMSIAVEDRLKSERMKTELITNVSHDIKTPLTSIINYADLIGKEKTENEKINEYSEVLVRQSDRLKRLIEDLVEASKASTGNLEVNLMPCDSATFVNQAAGEYQDKLRECNLTLVTSVPEEKLSIMADGRRMWRIFDNLMNNICKYSQSGTRVYLTLEREGDNAVFVFKNTSREQLNISEEELMERFVRGDQSRNTEGNGLGLSIAKSMAELQNGSLKIAIDGDLFKASLSFPVID